MAVGWLAGFISAIAGNGGLLTLPALLWAGVPPINALATNKLQSVFGTLTSTLNYFRRGHIGLRELRAPALWAVLGSSVGVVVVQALGNDFLLALLPWLLIAVAVYFWLSPRIGDLDTEPRLGQRTFAVLGGGGIGFYGGFFGPGMGSLYALAFVAGRGYNMIKATAHTKVMVLATNATAMAVFIASGKMWWLTGLAMGVAQIVGARLGSNLVMARGARIVRPVVIVATIAMAVKLLVDQ